VWTRSRPDPEAIRIDGGPTDATPALIAEFPAGDGWIRVARQRGTGPSAARDAGATLVGKRILMLRDADARVFLKAPGAA
jgi:glycosyltransferase involved in cell wall biosynthesis